LVGMVFSWQYVFSQKQLYPVLPADQLSNC